jgi:hypothetical protein
MIPALACVSKGGLPLPNDALALVGHFLRKPTPSAQAMRERPVTYQVEHHPDLDIRRWSIYVRQVMAGRTGWGLFVTNMKYFQMSHFHRRYRDREEREYHLLHRRLGYVERFDALTHEHKP